ncbi:MAG: VanZ family protein [Prevotella sp.]
MIKILISYPLSALCVAAIWTVCLIDIPETPVSDVRLIDKWAHVFMYLILGLLTGMEHLRRHGRKTVSWLRLTGLVWLMPVVMSGIIEILQAYCTGGRRSGDWLDFLANAIGSTAALIIMAVLARGKKRVGRS